MKELPTIARLALRDAKAGPSYIQYLEGLLREAPNSGTPNSGTPNSGTPNSGKLSELWEESPHAALVLEHINRLDFDFGERKKEYKNLSGVQFTEAPHLRALGLALPPLEYSHYADGRRCSARVKKQHRRLGLVIDTSLSMSWGSRLVGAKALVASVYAALDDNEREDCKLFRFNEHLSEIRIEDLPGLISEGGTNLQCLSPCLRGDPRRRWVVITDGNLPSPLPPLGPARICIISLGVNHPDKRVVMWRGEKNRVVEQRLRELLN